MNIKKAIKLIPGYLDNGLSDQEMQDFRVFLEKNKELQREMDVYQRSWDMLDEIQMIDPSPQYVSNFWTELSSRKTFSENMKEWAQWIFVPKRLAVSFSGVCVMILLIVFVSHNSLQILQPELMRLAGSDTEMIENMDLAENLEIIKMMDVLEDFEIINTLEVA